MLLYHSSIDWAVGFSGRGSTFASEVSHIPPDGLLALVLTTWSTLTYGSEKWLVHSNGHTPGTPCWLTHHITACCLHKLMKSAYSDYCTETAVISGEVHSFEAWCDSRKQQSPPFQFWYLVLSMELEILSLIQQ